jgi:hypothetical protein
LAEEQATMQLVEEYEHSSQERLRSMVRIYEEVSYDETAVSRASTAEDDNSDISINASPPQTLYCAARAQYLVKRRSKQKARHEYPVKRGGNPSDALVASGIQTSTLSSLCDVSACKKWTRVMGSCLSFGARG